MIFGAALLGAVSIPLDRPGIGWVIAALAGAAALTIAALPSARSGATGAPDRSGGATGVPVDPRPTETRRDDRPAHLAGQPTSKQQTGPNQAPDPTQPANPNQPTKPNQPTNPDQRANPAAGTRPTRSVVDRLTWAAATVALAGVGTVRAADWLFVLCLLTAGMTACLTVTDGRTVRGLLLGVVTPPVAALRAASWLARGVRRSGAGSTVGRSVVTAVVSVCLLVTFGALFTSADAAFANLVDDVLPQLSTGTVIRWTFLFVVIAAALLGAAFLLAAPPDLTRLDSQAGRRVRRLEWAIPVALLDLLFAAFVLVQITVLFGGSEHVLHTAGLTFAEYARGGFWQLLMVTAGSLLVIAGASRWAPREPGPDRLLIRLLLGTLALLSLVVVGSALYRMNVYTAAYGATRLRLLVAACELWLGLLFVLVLAVGVRLRAGWLPRLVLAAAVVALLGLAVANPDRLIADRNIDRYVATGRLDIWYLSSLSADAAPAMKRLTGHQRDCALAAIAADLAADPDDWRGTNLGRFRARTLVGPAGKQLASIDCSDVAQRY